MSAASGGAPPSSPTRRPSPQWETLIDVDQLAQTEGKNWVYSRASCAIDLTRCLVGLSNGGTDAVVLREFDPVAKRFLDDGFNLGEAKAEAAYIDANTILFSTDFGPGTLTASGYPRIVKLWRRGQAIAEAKIVFEGKHEDVLVSPGVFQGRVGRHGLDLARASRFFESEYSVVVGEEAVKLPLPLSVDIKAEIDGYLIATMRKDWTPENGPPDRARLADRVSAEGVRRHPRAAARRPFSMRPMPARRFSVSPRAATPSTPRSSRTSPAASTPSSAIPRRAHGAKRVSTCPPAARPASPPPTSSGRKPISPIAGSSRPTTLFSEQGRRPAQADQVAARALRRLALSGERSTRRCRRTARAFPISWCARRTRAGPRRCCSTAMAASRFRRRPFYWTGTGLLWLPRGGAYAVANIRGGGEFGPSWHDAALKVNRQKAYDDFIAVAEDMIRRGLTTPSQLGIMGGSNGGLLVGAVMAQRPDLFGAVVCQVPLLDMIRFSKIGAGASWVGEYGDPENPVEREAILKYSPYQNVKPGVKYPPVFFITATSDDRVTPVHARKMAARMEEQGHDVLFYENTDGGHAAAANHSQQAEMNALHLRLSRAEARIGSAPANPAAVSCFSISPHSRYQAAREPQ